MKVRKWIYILTIVILINFVIMLISQQVKIAKSQKEIERLNGEIEKTIEESEKLKKEIDNAESRETIEAIAREELGLIYPDERKFVDSNS